MADGTVIKGLIEGDEDCQGCRKGVAAPCVSVFSFVSPASSRISQLSCCLVDVTHGSSRRTEAIVCSFMRLL